MATRVKGGKTKGEKAVEPRQVLSWSNIDLVRRHSSLWRRPGGAALVIDMQEKLLPAVRGRYDLLQNATRFLKAARILSTPLLVTEQYPKGLGPTDRRLAPLLEGAAFFEKTAFSAVGEESFLSHIQKAGITHLCILGVETHVCVAQTALDLKTRGLDVSVLADIVSSRREADHAVALERLRHSGVVVTTSEAALFEALESSDTREFKDILPLVK